jgi:hypothetical protein
LYFPLSKIKEAKNWQKGALEKITKDAEGLLCA